MAQAAALVWLFVGAVCITLFTRLAVAPAAWLALTVVLHASRSMPSYGIAFVWLAVYAALAIGLRGTLPMTGPAYYVIVAFNCTVFVLPFAIDRVVVTRLASAGWTLVFPMAFVAAEFLRGRFSPAATWGSIAYTQYGNLALMQVAAFVGIYGITFLVAWFASTIEWAGSRGFEWGVVRTPVLILIGIFGTVLLGGGLRLRTAPSDRPSVRTATLNRPTDLFAPGEMTRIAEGRLSADERTRMAGKLARLHDWFLDGSRREARAGARLIAWPEQNLLVFAEDEAAFLDRAKRLAAEERVYLAMGLGTVHVNEALPFENKVILVDPTGTIIVSYRKTHPVPGWEASIMRRGDGRLPVVGTDLGRMATAICFDADFPEFVRQAGLGEADVLIVPANEWKAIKSVHAQMAAFRAIENGVSLLRPAASGISSAVDPWGRVLGVADFFAPGDGTLTAQVPMTGVRTLYAGIGDLFAWLCVAGLVASLCLTIMVRSAAE